MMSVTATSRSPALRLLLQCVLQLGVHGHLYMMTPVSRNLWGTTAFNDPSFEYINYCPHCYQSRGPSVICERAERLTDSAVLELYGNGAWPLLTAYERGEVAANGNFLESDAIAVRHGICGDPEQTASEDSNRYGRANTNYPVIETYTEGSIVEIKIVVSTSHVGHMEFFLCDTADMHDPDGVVNQECFNMHPLDRAEDDEDASPIDSNFPGRYYLDPPCRAAETDQTLLPGAFPGYVATDTGNSCMHVGYDEFNPPSWPSECAPNKDDWIVTGLGMCGDGGNYPEEYWNCADIEIVADGGATNPAPVPEPSSEPETPAPIDEETPVPTNVETPAPINDETPAPTNEETPAPINDETPAPTNEETPAPINDEMPAPTNEETPVPINDETPAPTNVETPGPINDETPAPTNEETPAPINDETPAPTNEETPSPTNTETSDPINLYTSAPTKEATPSPMTSMTPYPIAMLTPNPVNDEIPGPTHGDTPAPIIEQTTAPDTPAPSPSEAEPFNEPILITLPPATFAPSIVATEMPPDECDDPVAAYGQCGGDSYEGSTCCRPSYECTAVADCYSECRPMAELNCSEGWGQCGGLNWDGPTCCWEGAICLERNEWFSQCVPEARIYDGATRA